MSRTYRTAGADPDNYSRILCSSKRCSSPPILKAGGNKPPGIVAAAVVPTARPVTKPANNNYQRSVVQHPRNQRSEPHEAVGSDHLLRSGAVATTVHILKKVQPLCALAQYLHVHNPQQNYVWLRVPVSHSTRIRSLSSQNVDHLQPTPNEASLKITCKYCRNCSTGAGPKPTLALASNSRAESEGTGLQNWPPPASSPC